ncbi:hypothetical protein C8Q73DRAFT_707317 [Cubamyces lactineus]|nr:hypothetical protein C8Q73DRAFT_707317 [Cubamyces lactineus]
MSQAWETSSTQTTEDGYDVLRKSRPWTVPLPDVYLSRNENSAQTYGFEPKDAKSRYRRLGNDAQRVTVGPMPVTSFMNTFLPTPQDLVRRMPPCKNLFNGIKPQNALESSIYKVLLKGLNGGKRPRCPGYAFRDTSTHADQLEGKVGSVKPDIMCYAESFLPEVEVHGDKATNEWVSVTRIAYAETFIEVKTNQSDDHYEDPPPSANRDVFEFVFGKHARTITKTADELKGHLGQNVAYATDMCARQHRRFCFSVSVSGCSARLIRWDRAGAIVSEAFDYVSNPELLCEFFWRFAHLTDEERGYDMTVQPATSAEDTVFRKAIEEHIQRQLIYSTPDMLQKALDTHYMPGHVSVVWTPPDIDNPAPINRLLVSRPIVTPLYFAGRCTRVYWAVNPDVNAQKKVVLLKDTWRLDGLGADIEGIVLHELRAKGVPNIPRVLHHGDVVMGQLRGQPGWDRTVTRDHLKKVNKWPCQRRRQHVRVTPRIHYRLVLDVAGYQLLSLSGTHELLHSTYDAFQALVAAYQLGRRLHRDVHPGNIILYNDSELGKPTSRRTGYLVDWDISSSIDGTQTLKDLYRPSHQWQFVSVDLLGAVYPKPAHDIVHDMESMLYVVLYCSLTRLPHTEPSDAEGFRDLVHYLFDVGSVYRGENVGGDGKRTNMRNRQFTKLIIWESPELKQWIDTVCNMHSPLKGDPLTKDDSWTCERLDQFWASFLQENSGRLPKNDFVDNIRRHGGGLAGHVPRSLNSLPRHPTFTPRSSKRVRFEPPSSSSRAFPSNAFFSVPVPLWSSMQSASASSSMVAPSMATAPPTSPTVLSAASEVDRHSRSPYPDDRHSPTADTVVRERSLTPRPQASLEQVETPHLRRSTRPRKRPRYLMS